MFVSKATTNQLVHVDDVDLWINTWDDMIETHVTVVSVFKKNPYQNSPTLRAFWTVYCTLFSKFSHFDLWMVSGYSEKWQSIGNSRHGIKRIDAGIIIDDLDTCTVIDVLARTFWKHIESRECVQQQISTRTIFREMKTELACYISPSIAMFTLFEVFPSMSRLFVIL